MSSSCYLSVHQSENVEFTDLAALNTTLASMWGINELVDFYGDKTPNPEFDGWLKLIDGQVRISSCEEHCFDGYRTKVQVWGCWTHNAAHEIANNIKSGKLVLKFAEEGWDAEYYILTPGKVETKDDNDVSF